MKAQPIPDPRPGARRGPRGELEHGACAQDHAGGAPGRERLVDPHHHPLVIEEEGVDRLPHPEGVDGAAGIDPEALSLAERRPKEEAAETRSEGSRPSDAISHLEARCLIFRSEHETIVP